MAHPDRPHYKRTELFHFMSNPLHLDLAFYAVAIPAVVLMGLAKGGFSGVGQISVPLLAIVVSPVQAAAILLPILLVQDAVGVWAFRHDWDGHILKVMVPGAAVGIAAGYLLAAKVSVSAVLGALGAISIIFALYQLWGRRAARALASPPRSSTPMGFVLGIASGFTSRPAGNGRRVRRRASARRGGCRRRRDGSG